MIPPLELSLDECLDLLSGGVVGRVAMATAAGPRIVPVNYAVHDHAIVFRTTPYSEMSTHGWDTELAFEVDHVDYETHQGWSVVALGRGGLVDDPEEIAEIRRSWEPRPWAGGTRNVFREAAVAQPHRPPDRQRLVARNAAALSTDALTATYLLSASSRVRPPRPGLTRTPR